jgi:hypothetical protein
MDTSDFLSTLVKGIDIDLLCSWWYALRDTILPNMNLKRKKKRGASQHKHIKCSDIAQLFNPSGAINEVNAA